MLTILITPINLLAVACCMYMSYGSLSSSSGSYYKVKSVTLRGEHVMMCRMSDVQDIIKKEYA